MGDGDRGILFYSWEWVVFLFRGGSVMWQGWMAVVGGGVRGGCGWFLVTRAS